MRILALAILTIATAFSAPPARAQTYDPAYPVCLQIYQGFTDYYFECAYSTLAQCNMSASGRRRNVSSIRIMRGAKPRRRHDETGDIAASIERDQGGSSNWTPSNRFSPRRFPLTLTFGRVRSTYPPPAAGPF
jgi:hypothetical protein